MSRTFFIADTHFGHSNIVTLGAGRPFATIDEHDRTLMELWNAMVGPKDTVYHLGDFGHKASGQYLRAIFDRLHGTKILIKGNHDKQAALSLPWSDIQTRIETKIDDMRVVLDHYPMWTWNGAARGAIQLYGHVHGRKPATHNSLDVGVDVWDFMPVTLPQIVARLAEQPKPTWREPQDDDDEEAPAGPGCP